MAASVQACPRMGMPTGMACPRTTVDSSVPAPELPPPTRTSGATPLSPKSSVYMQRGASARGTDVSPRADDDDEVPIFMAMPRRQAEAAATVVAARPPLSLKKDDAEADLQYV